MADTPEMAPDRPAPARKPATRRNGRAVTRSSEDELQDQIERLQDDVRAIMNSIGKLGNEKVGEARRTAKTEYRNLMEAGQNAVSAAQDEFGEVEQQIKSTIRKRPLTAVLGAVGIGFLLAILTR